VLRSVCYFSTSDYAVLNFLHLTQLYKQKDICITFLFRLNECVKSNACSKIRLAASIDVLVELRCALHYCYTQVASPCNFVFLQQSVMSSGAGGSVIRLF
jgi:hypothetical protein